MQSDKEIKKVVKECLEGELGHVFKSMFSKIAEMQKDREKELGELIVNPADDCDLPVTQITEGSTQEEIDQWIRETGWEQPDNLKEPEKKK